MSLVEARLAPCLALLLLAAAAGHGNAAAASTQQGVVPPVLDISIGSRTGTVPPTFLAHGWEPWTATMAFGLFTNPSFRTALSHLRGQTIRFGGISADWLEYVVDAEISAPCTWSREAGRPFTVGGQCPFSTGAFDLLLDTVSQAGIGLIFDLNELIGRNCSQPSRNGHAGKGPEWCGDVPARWDLAPVRALLQHIRCGAHTLEIHCS